MEIAVIVVIAAIAFALVLMPLLKRSAASAADAREFATTADDLPAASATTAHMLDNGGTAHLTQPTDDVVEREVLRYRTALRAGTLCTRCGQANPDDSRYCFECGKKLPRAAAQEFQ